ncbi:MAG: ZIP family metal transporter [Planctomycetes bacterium]|nr:ZIP family metal transporter [Planctomycetota bacterium]
MTSPIVDGILGGLCAGLATGLGAFGVYSVRELSRRANDLLLACAAGVMLAASFFSLLAPSIEVAREQTSSNAGAAFVVCTSVLCGALALTLAHRSIPHEHFGTGREGPAAVHVRRIWLFVLAISLHNLPEGMAVGVGFGAGDATSGLSLAVGIGLQNIPEGLAVAASLVSIGYGRTRAFLISLGTGAIEAVGGAAGAAAASWVAALLPWALGFAAGAMLFVISGEIIPETHRGDSKGAATYALLAGFLVMTGLGIVLA